MQIFEQHECFEMQVLNDMNSMRMLTPLVLSRDVYDFMLFSESFYFMKEISMYGLNKSIKS